MIFYICEHQDGGGDPFIVVAANEQDFERVFRDAMQDLDGSEVEQVNDRDGTMYCRCYNEVDGGFTIIAEEQQEVYGLKSNSLERAA